MVQLNWRVLLNCLLESILFEIRFTLQFAWFFTYHLHWWFSTFQQITLWFAYNPWKVWPIQTPPRLSNFSIPRLQFSIDRFDAIQFVVKLHYSCHLSVLNLLESLKSVFVFDWFMFSAFFLNLYINPIITMYAHVAWYPAEGSVLCVFWIILMILSIIVVIVICWSCYCYVILAVTV